MKALIIAELLTKPIFLFRINNPYIPEKSQFSHKVSGMIQKITIKDHIQESQLFLNRTVASLFIVIILISILIIRMFFLQVVKHNEYETQSNDNRLRLMPLSPTRGLIYDKNNQLLAENLPTYSLEIIPEQIKNLDNTIHRLQKIVHITDYDIAQFKKTLKQKRRFDSIPIRFRLSEVEVARFAVNQHVFPAVDIQARLDRHYPLNTLTAHVLGYVGRINEAELNRIDHSKYAGTSHIGKVGIERYYEDILHGEVGMQRVETNASGRILNIINRTDPTPGATLKLHLDIELQQTAAEALGEYTGSIVAIDIKTGGILVFVSKPGFNPNLFVNGIRPTEYRILQTSSGKPLFNRALKGQYPPGSIVKPFVGLAGLINDITTPEQKNYCPGFYSLPESSHRYRCWKKWGHRHVNLKSAIAQSCDVYFYDLAFQLGIDKLHEFMTLFGFGQKTGIDMLGERDGIMPSRQWKRDNKNEAWFPGETVNTGIGQGFMLTTPLQLANATATFARKGIIIQPKLVQEIIYTNQGKSEIKKQTPQKSKIQLNTQHLQLIKEAMIEVIHGPRGTARAIGQDAAYTIAAKTGTAQVFTVAQDASYDEKTIAKKLRDHALFVAFAPADDPRIALSIIVENGGHGGSTAGPIARKIMDHYLGVKKNNLKNSTQ